ncbi:MAG: hypothetical protein E7445_05470 [Ruminococcaceae bacterium]|nr:hypothetical protein [Oscillospiraceae bacterium]
MLVAFGELTPLAWGLVGVTALFVTQLLLCFRARSRVLRSMPVLLVMAGLLYSGATYAGLFGSYSAGAISGNQLAGLICAIVVGIAAFGVALAWLVYGVVMFAVDRY